MGVLPFQFMEKENRLSLGLKGNERITITGLSNDISPGMDVKMLIIYSNGKNKTHRLRLLVNTSTEIDYLKTGGILQYVYKNISNIFVSIVLILTRMKGLLDGTFYSYHWLLFRNWL